MRPGFLNSKPKSKAPKSEKPKADSSTGPSELWLLPNVDVELSPPDDPNTPAGDSIEFHEAETAVLLTWDDLLTGKFDIHATLKNMLKHKVFKDNPPRFGKDGRIVIETDEEKAAVFDCAVPWVPVQPSEEAAKWNLPPRPASGFLHPFLSRGPNSHTFQLLLDRILEGPSAHSSPKQSLNKPPTLDGDAVPGPTHRIFTSLGQGTSSTPTWMDKLFGQYKEKQQLGILNYMAPVTGAPHRQAADGSIPMASERLMTDFSNKLTLEAARLDLDPSNADVFGPLEKERAKLRYPMEPSITVNLVRPIVKPMKAGFLLKKPLNFPPPPPAADAESSQAGGNAGASYAPSLPGIPLGVKMDRNDPRTIELMKRAPVVSQAQLEAIMGGDIILDTVEVLLPGPEGRHCSCLLKKGVKEYLEALPSFQPLPEVQNSLMYTISAIKERNLGVVATQLIRAGDLIMTERPLIVKPRIFAADPRTLQPVFNGLDAKDQIAFMELHNCKAPSFGELYGRILTNDVAISLSSEGEKSYSGIFKDFSRCNHSCAPNATYNFNLATFALELHAVRNIQPSEEICITYMDLLIPYSKRRNELLKYAIDCTCRICALSPELSAASDARRDAMERWPKDHISFKEWLENKETAPENQFLEETQKLLDMAEAEGLEELVADNVKAMAGAYAALGREKQYKKWAEKARRAQLANGRSPKPYDTASTNPTAHKFWGTRKAK